MIVYDFGNSPEELQEVIWELSVRLRKLEDQVADLEFEMENDEE